MRALPAKQAANGERGAGDGHDDRGRRGGGNETCPPTPLRHEHADNGLQERRGAQFAGDDRGPGGIRLAIRARAEVRLELRRLELGELPVEAGGGGLAGASAIAGWDRSQHRFLI
jgi:hypothetical protein